MIIPLGDFSFVPPFCAPPVYASFPEGCFCVQKPMQVQTWKIREIYLKGFGICVREAQPKAVMTSYNLLNGTHTAENRGLIMGILRAEYGYQGIVMTDWVPPMTGDVRSAHRDSQAQYVAAAGGDLFMPGNKGDYDNLLQGIDSGAVTLEQVKINASRVVRTVRALTQE